MNQIQQIWVYLGQSPLLWLALTLWAYQFGLWVFRHFDMNPLLNPALVAVILLVVMLRTMNTDYQTYFEGAQFVHFLLGPATVAMAVPLYRNLAHIKRLLWPIMLAVTVGGMVAAGSAAAIAWALGGSGPVIATLATKSVTTPVAMSLSKELGGSPALAAVFVLMTGVTGSMSATFLFNRLGIRNWHARGLGTGVAAHGLGTARAFQVHERAGVFSSLGLGLNAIITALLLPPLAKLVIRLMPLF
jgi:predicted murein hydrolase (TIGR00659 family)